MYVVFQLRKNLIIFSFFVFIKTDSILRFDEILNNKFYNNFNRDPIVHSINKILPECDNIGITIVRKRI